MYWELKSVLTRKKCLTTQTKKGSCCLNETGELLVDIFSYVKLKKCDLMWYTVEWKFIQRAFLLTNITQKPWELLYYQFVF